MIERNQIFVSYAHNDRKCVNMLVDELRRAGHQIWMDTISLPGGVEWERAIRRGVEESDSLVLCWSESASASDHVRMEIEWAFQAGVRIVPLLLDDTALPAWLKSIQFISFQEMTYDDAFLRLLDSLPKPRDIERIPFLVDWPRLTYFQGRDEDLERLHDLLTHAGKVIGIAPAALTGMGGIGKTQLAVEYAWRYRYYYSGGVYWVNASEEWAPQFAALAERLRLVPADPSSPDRTGQMIAALEAYLRGRPNSLLILDNVHAPSEVVTRTIGFGTRVRSFGAHVLFTTRRNDLPDAADGLRLGVLSEQAAELILTRSRHDLVGDPLLRRICASLGNLPLAIDSAARFLERHPNVTPEAFLADILQRGAIASIQGNGADLTVYYAHRLKPILDTQWESLDNSRAEEVMMMAVAFSEAAIIPIARLSLLTGFRDNPSTLVTELTDALNALDDAALLEELAEDTVRVHPLVRDYVRRRYVAEQFQVAFVQGVNRVVAALRDPWIARSNIVSRGIDEVLSDLRDIAVATAYAQPTDLLDLRRELEWESYRLRQWDSAHDPGGLWQQLRELAHHEDRAEWRDALDHALQDEHLPYFRSLSWSRYPNDRALVRVLYGHTQRISQVVAALSDRAISISDDHTIRVWDLERAQAIDGIEQQVGASLCQMPNGHLLFGMRDHSICQWDNVAAAIVQTYKGHGDRITAVSWLSGGRFASGSADCTVRIWEERGGLTCILRGHSKAVTAIAAAGDGKFATASADGTCSIWNATSGHRIHIVNESAPITCLTWLDPTSLVMGLINGTVCVHRLDDRRSLPRRFHGHTKAVTAIIALPDGRVVSSSADSTLRVWEPSSGNILHIFEGHADAVSSCALVGNNHIVSASADATLRLWSSEHLVPTTRYPAKDAHTKRVTSIACVTPSSAVTASQDGTLRIWDVASGLPSNPFGDRRSAVNCVATTDETHVVSGSADHSLRLWDLTAAKPVRIYEGHGCAVLAVDVWQATGLIVSGGVDGTLLVWNVGSARCTATLQGHRGAVNCVATTDETHVVSGSADHSLRLWDLVAGKQVQVYSGHQGAITDVILLDSNRLLSSSADQVVHLWNIETGQILRSFRGHSRTVTSLSRLGIDHFVSTGDDRVLCLWHIDDSNPRARLNIDGTPVSMTTLGRSVLVGDNIGSLRGFDVVL